MVKSPISLNLVHVLVFFRNFYLFYFLFICVDMEQGRHDWKAYVMCSVEESIKMWQKAILSVQCLVANLLHLKTITQHTIL
jgi:hypothetical protein